jgi:gliding motility-associated-like protein
LFANASVYNTSVSGLDVGLNTLSWTITNGVCAPSVSQVEITTYENPTVSDAGVNQEVCLFDATLAGNEPLIGSGLWSTTGSGLFANASIYNTNVSGLDVGLNTLSWTITNGVCAPSVSQVEITTYENPSIAVAGVDSEVCGPNATINANNPVIGTGTWSTTGSAMFADINASTTTVSNMTNGTNTFIWTISNGACSPTIDQIDVLSNPLPISDLPVEGNVVCEGSDGQLIISLSETDINYDAYIGANLVGNGAGNSEDLNITILTTDLVIGNNLIAIVATNPITRCTSTFTDDATITVNPNPSINQLVNGNIVCDGTEGIVTIVSSENLANYEALINGFVVGTGFGNGNDLEIVIDPSNLTVGNNVVSFSSALLNCKLDLVNDATIFVNENPKSDLDVSDSQVCYGKEPIFTISNSENDIFYELFINGISVASGTGEGSNLDIIVPPNYLIIGDNQIHIIATNNQTTCSVPLDNNGNIRYEYCDLIIYDGFSPNDDGINETFIIEGLERYPNHRVIILNRWGNKVYEASPYLNDWDGTNMFGVTVGGKDLPTGTYFYIIDPGNGEKVVKGYIYLNR